MATPAAASATSPSAPTCIGANVDDFHKAATESGKQIGALIVDDVLLNRKLAGAMFGRLGWRISYGFQKVPGRRSVDTVSEA